MDQAYSDNDSPLPGAQFAQPPNHGDTKVRDLNLTGHHPIDSKVTSYD